MVDVAKGMTNTIMKKIIVLGNCLCMNYNYINRCSFRSSIIFRILTFGLFLCFFCMSASRGLSPMKCRSALWNSTGFICSLHERLQTFQQQDYGCSRLITTCATASETALPSKCTGWMGVSQISRIYSWVFLTQGQTKEWKTPKRSKRNNLEISCP